MKEIRHQIAIFGSYNKQIFDLYNKMTKIFDSEIQNVNMNSGLDAPGVPLEVPRIELFISGNIQINCARSRIDIISTNYVRGIEILDRLKADFAYSGFGRIGIVSAIFLNFEFKNYIQDVSGVFEKIDYRALTEFGVRFNSPESVDILGTPIEFNHLQNLELGEYSGEKGYLYQQDVNTKIEESGKIADDIEFVKQLIEKSYQHFLLKRIIM